MTTQIIPSITQSYTYSITSGKSNIPDNIDNSQNNLYDTAPLTMETNINTYKPHVINSDVESFKNYKEGFNETIEQIDKKVSEEKHLANRLHILLYVWFIIGLFILVVFILCIISDNGWNPLATYSLIAIVLFSFYYIFKNISKK
jgi:soluble cytochrome b562